MAVVPSEGRNDPGNLWTETAPRIFEPDHGARPVSEDTASIKPGDAGVWNSSSSCGGHLGERFAGRMAEMSA